MILICLWHQYLINLVLLTTLPDHLLRMFYALSAISDQLVTVARKAAVAGKKNKEGIGRKWAKVNKYEHNGAGC